MNRLQRFADLYNRHPILYTADLLIITLNLAVITILWDQRTWQRTALSIAITAALAAAIAYSFRNEIELDRLKAERHRTHKQRFPGVFDPE